MHPGLIFSNFSNSSTVDAIPLSIGHILVTCQHILFFTASLSLRNMSANPAMRQLRAGVEAFFLQSLRLSPVHGLVLWRV